MKIPNCKILEQEKETVKPVSSIIDPSDLFPKTNRLPRGRRNNPTWQ